MPISPQIYNRPCSGNTDISQNIVLETYAPSNKTYFKTNRIVSKNVSTEHQWNTLPMENILKYIHISSYNHHRVS